MEVERIRIDCRGLRCPAPILEVSRAAKRFRGVPVILEVDADDHDFPKDIEAWCRSTRSEIAGEIARDAGIYSAVLLLNGASTAARPATAAVARAAPLPSPAPMAPPPLSAGPPPVLTPPDAGELDLRGLTPPAALQRLGSALTERGSVLFAADAGPFTGAVYAWAGAMGAHVAQLEVVGGIARGRVDLAVAEAPAIPTPVAAAQAPSAAPVAAQGAESDLCTLLVLRNDFESLMAALMVANASAAQGMRVMIFFSFWGVNLLRGDEPRATTEVGPRASPLQSMMKWMMPRGPDRQQMSKMNMGGLGMAMMRFFMRKQNVLGLKELLAEAAQQDVRFCVCTMSMGIMGIDKRDLMDLSNIEYGGVTTFSERARRSALSLVF